MGAPVVAALVELPVPIIPETTGAGFAAHSALDCGYFSTEKMLL